MKLFNKIIVIIILIGNIFFYTTFLILGIIYNRQYSCDNGYFVVTNDITSNDRKKCNDIINNKCISVCNKNNSTPSEECIKCLLDNGCKNFNCISDYKFEYFFVSLIIFIILFLIVIIIGNF